MKKLYHASQKFIEVDEHGFTNVFQPRIPPNRATGEDCLTPRICVSTSIEGAALAIEAISSVLFPAPLYCYEAVGVHPLDIVSPVPEPDNKMKLFFETLYKELCILVGEKEAGQRMNKYETYGVVPDCETTGELWIVAPTKFRFLAKYCVYRDTDYDGEYKVVCI